MADESIEVTCHCCGHAFSASPSERGRVAECPGCGGWLDVAPDGPPPEVGVSPSEFVQAQMRSEGRRHPRGGGEDSCGA